jgi:hypothetical protein
MLNVGRSGRRQQSIQRGLCAGKLGFNFGHKRDDIHQAVFFCAVLELLCDGPERGRTDVGRGAFDGMRGADERGGVAGGEALVDLRDAQRRVLDKNAYDFTEKRVAAVGIECAEVVNGFLVEDG